eukprot:7848150-Heterocapsa_arctica.AAC.1
MHAWEHRLGDGDESHPRDAPDRIPGLVGAHAVEVEHIQVLCERGVKRRGIHAHAMLTCPGLKLSRRGFVTLRSECADRTAPKVVLRLSRRACTQHLRLSSTSPRRSAGPSALTTPTPARRRATHVGSQQGRWEGV